MRAPKIFYDILSQSDTMYIYLQYISVGIEYCVLRTGDRREYERFTPKIFGVGEQSHT